MMRTSLLLGAVCVLGLLAAPATAATKIYRTVDQDGNVVFTDVPPKPDQPGDAVELNRSNAFTPPPQSPPTAPPETRPDDDPEDEADLAEQAAAVRYQSLSVASPGNDAAVRDNAGNVAVTASLEPDLRPGHALQLYLDGELRETVHGESGQLTNVDRGTHRVELRVVDQAGATLIASEPSVFHLQRRSVILQPPKPKRKSD